MKIIKIIYNNRLDRLLLGCEVEQKGIVSKVNKEQLQRMSKQFENAVGVFARGTFYIRSKPNYPKIAIEYLEDKMILKVYHGTDNAHFKPKYNLGKRNNDYGMGLYTTPNVELAKEWAVGLNKEGYVFELELNTAGLRVLNLDNYPIETWLAILYTYRTFEVEEGLVKQRLEEFINKYKIKDLESYDIIIGYRADDSYFSYALDYLNIVISREQLTQALYYGELGQQVCIKSKKAFDKLKVKGSKKVNLRYKQDYLKRDMSARAKYKSTEKVEVEVKHQILDALKERK